MSLECCRMQKFLNSSEKRSFRLIRMKKIEFMQTEQAKSKNSIVKNIHGLALFCVEYTKVAMARDANRMMNKIEMKISVLAMFFKSSLIASFGLCAFRFSSKIKRPLQIMTSIMGTITSENRCALQVRIIYNNETIFDRYLIQILI